MKLVLGIAALLAFTAPAAAASFTLPAADIAAGMKPVQIRAKKKAIDKSCLMICEKWGEDTCEKWVMKCKGDPGYPKAMLLMQ